MNRKNFNAVPGHPDWYFGVVRRGNDGNAAVTVYHHDAHDCFFDLTVAYDRTLMYAPYREVAQQTLDVLVASQLEVSAQSTVNRRGETKWSYVIGRPGWWPYVSDYRFASEEAALRAGAKDAAAAAALEQRREGTA